MAKNTPGRPGTVNLPTKDKTYRRQNPVEATPAEAKRTKQKEEVIAERTAREK